jgi:NAD(P)H-quinone oxidoreductase subunit 2
LVLTLVTTALAGILSNPLFTLANDAVAKTPILQAALKVEKPVAVKKAPVEAPQVSVKL